MGYFQPMNLPIDERVEIGTFSGCFKHTSATYKFYWLLAVLEAVEEGKERIEKRELFARMVANAWYTVQYFHVSFGKADSLEAAIGAIQEVEDIPLDASKAQIVDVLMQSGHRITRRALKHFDGNVPHKFLSPWLGSGSKSEVYRLSQHGFGFPPYALYDDHVLMQPDWMNYFVRNAAVLKDYCRWNLAVFLQARNPNVPDMLGKLERPERRGSLARQKKDYWDLVIAELGGVKCIYTQRELAKGAYDVEHFIPFQFLAHDQMWNLLPADPRFNSQKGDKLPLLTQHFKPFYATQMQAIRIIRDLRPKSGYLEDFLTVFRTLDISEQEYRNCVEPLLTIAHNNGFQYLRA